MKLSELKSIIRECIEELDESGPARRNRRKSGEHMQDIGDVPQRRTYDNRGRIAHMRDDQVRPNSTFVKYRGSGKKRQNDASVDTRVYRSSYKRSKVGK